VYTYEGEAYRSRLNFCQRWWLASRALLRYGHETLETVLGENVHTALCDDRALREEGMEVWFEILRWREGDQQHTQQLPTSERTLPANKRVYIERKKDTSANGGLTRLDCL
jgi:hypothetical protein